MSGLDERPISVRMMEPLKIFYYRNLEDFGYNLIAEQIPRGTVVLVTPIFRTGDANYRRFENLRRFARTQGIVVVRDYITLTRVIRDFDEGPVEYLR